MIDPHKLIGLAFVFTGLGMLVTSLFLRRVATKFQDVFRLIEEV